MAFTDFLLTVGDGHGELQAEIRTQEGYLELRFRDGADAKFCEWLSLSDDVAQELAAALLIGAHFCDTDNCVLSKAAPVAALAQALIAKIGGAS